MIFGRIILTASTRQFLHGGLPSFDRMRSENAGNYVSIFYQWNGVIHFLEWKFDWENNDLYDLFISYTQSNSDTLRYYLDYYLSQIY